MSNIETTKAPKKLQFRMMEDEYDCFAQLASEFAGQKAGSKVKFLRALITRHESEISADGNSKLGELSSVSKLKEDLTNRELRLAEVSHERDELRKNPNDLASFLDRSEPKDHSNHCHSVHAAGLLSNLSHPRGLQVCEPP